MKTTRVVIVDDEASVRSALAEVIGGAATLELVGTADDAVAGVDLVVRERPDVALVDVKMPRGGGAHAATAINAHSPETRVIALSAYADRGAVLEMLRAGAIAYLVKGCSVDELLETIARAARGEGTLASEITSEVVDELATHLGRQQKEHERLGRRTNRILRVLDEQLLRIAFQPIVDIGSRRTVGFEALARFPAEFGIRTDVWFADANEVGLGEKLELAAAEEALGQLGEIPSDAFLSVNLSPAVVVRDRCANLLAGAPRGRVVVEMTEHAPVDDYEELRAALGELRDAEVRIAVDDTGAGFASLQHILQLGPDFIKLDNSLTHGIGTDASRRALAAALTTFATELGASIIAEGVERQEELDALRALGVPLAQGYLLGRPRELIAEALVS